MSYETILTERVGNVLKITLNRPERLNAASIPLAEELGAVFYDLGDARAVLITGAGKGFCSGADLAVRGEQSAIQQKGGSHRALQHYYNPLITQILRCPVPVITAVNGAAAGVGCSIALAGDFVLAAKSAYFLQAFVNIGLVPDGGSTWLLARAIGRARLIQLVAAVGPAAAAAPAAGAAAPAAAAPKKEEKKEDSEEEADMGFGKLWLCKRFDERSGVVMKPRKKGYSPQVNAFLVLTAPLSPLFSRSLRLNPFALPCNVDSLLFLRSK